MTIQINKGIADFLKSWLVLKIDGEEGSTFTLYYTNYIKAFGPRLQYFYNEQTKELLSLIAPSVESLKVLEIGSGTGTESLWMALMGARVLGVDIQDDRLRLARKRQKIIEEQLGRKLDCEFINKNILNLEENDYDIVWIEQAFHHLEPRDEIIYKLSLLVKTGGYIVISESNALNPLTQFQLFMKRGFKTIRTYTDSDGGDHVYGDERILTAKKMSIHLRQNGFDIKNVKHYRIFPSGDFFEWFFFIEKIWPKSWKFAFTHYNIVARKL